LHIAYMFFPLSGLFHYRNPALCRVSRGLPSAIIRALGKESICRVSL
jgi:hypothetical protein